MRKLDDGRYRIDQAKIIDGLLELASKTHYVPFGDCSGICGTAVRTRKYLLEPRGLPYESLRSRPRDSTSPSTDGR